MTSCVPWTLAVAAVALTVNILVVFRSVGGHTFVPFETAEDSRFQQLSSKHAVVESMGCSLVVAEDKTNIPLIPGRKDNASYSGSST